MSDNLKIAFVGDIALNDNYIKHYFNEKNPFENISHLFKRIDLIVGNLEVTCKGEIGVNKLKKPTLYTQVETLNYLNNLNVGLVSLANNHVYDNLRDGFQKTVNFLSQKKIRSTGAQLNKNNSNKNPWEILEIKEKRIAFLSYVHPETNPCLPENYDIEVNIYETDKIVDHIGKLTGKVDQIVLLLHWGLDNSSFPAPWQRNDARMFIRAGADLIIGHHAHVIQGFEVINGKQVFYGLGNFCFSPFTINNKRYELDHRKHTKSIMVIIDLSQSVKFEVLPLMNSNDWIYSGNKTIMTKFNIISKLIPFVSNILVWKLYVFYLSFFYKIYFFFFGNNRNPADRLKTINRKKIKRFFTTLKQASIK